MSHKYLAIDPGNNTGYAIFNELGDVVDNGEIKGHQEFLDWLDAVYPPPTVLIVEWYYVRNKQFNHEGSDVGTLRLIGAIERYAHQHKCTLVKQRSDTLGIGLRYIGMKYPKGVHVPDRVSALAHGVYWLQRNKIRKSRLAK